MFSTVFSITSTFLLLLFLSLCSMNPVPERLYLNPWLNNIEVDLTPLLVHMYSKSHNCSEKKTHLFIDVKSAQRFIKSHIMVACLINDITGLTQSNTKFEAKLSLLWSQSDLIWVFTTYHLWFKTFISEGMKSDKYCTLMLWIYSNIRDWPFYFWRRDLFHMK